MNCEICLEKFNFVLNKPYSLYPCGHTFCAECLAKLNGRNCSKCRKIIAFKQINFSLLDLLYDNFQQDINIDIIYSKLDLIEFLKEPFFQQIKESKLMQKHIIEKLGCKLKNSIDFSILKLEQNKEKSIQTVNQISHKCDIKLNKIKDSEILTNSKIKNIEERGICKDKLDLDMIFERDLDLKNVYLQFKEKLNLLYLDKTSLRKIQIESYLLNEHAENYYNEGSELLFDARNRRKALELVDNAIGLMPNSAKAYCLKGRLFYALDQYKKSLECFEKSIELDASYIMSYNFKSSSLLNEAKNDKAAEMASFALSLNQNPKNACEFMNKAFSLSILNKNQDALFFIDKAIELDPLNGFYYYLKSYDTCTLQRKKESIEMLDIAIELLPNFEKVYNNKGCEYYLLGDYDDALKMYNKALELNPHYFFTFRNKVELYEHLNKYQDLIDTVDKFMELNPDKIFVNQYKIKSFTLLGKKDDAIDLCLKILKDEMSMSETYKYCLKFIFDHKKYEEALFFSYKAFYLDNSNDVLVFEIKLMSLIQLKKFQEALDSIQEFKIRQNNIFRAEKNSLLF